MDIDIYALTNDKKHKLDYNMEDIVSDIFIV